MQGAVITGPTGAVGMALIEKCIEQGIPVLAVCHRNSKRRDILPENHLLSVIELDLQEYASYIPEDLGKYDTFFHLAWEGTYGEARNNLLNQEKNIRYALDAANLAKRFGCKTFVGAGSQAEYGRVDGILKPDTPAFPENGYGIAKLCAGQMSRTLCKQLGIRHIWTRILSIYGPYDKEYTMVMSILKKMLSGERVEVTKAEQIWDYLYSKDAAEMMMRLVDTGKDGKIYCLGSGQAKPLREYIEIMKETSKTKQEPAYGAVPYANNQVMHLEADLGDVYQDTGYLPKTSFEEGIQNTIRYLKKV